MLRRCARGAAAARPALLAGRGSPRISPPGCLGWRASSSKRYSIKRVLYPWKVQLERDSWEFLKQDMVNHFERQPARDSTVNIQASEWPKFVMKEHFLEAGKLPAMITGFGPPRKCVFDREEVTKIAFDEPEGHLSHLFKGRLWRIHIGEWIEECVVSDVSVHQVHQEMYFVRFRRHIPGQVTTLPIPVSISGLWGCPAYHAGGHVDLAMPTIMCECVGERIPPPFVVDVSHMQLEDPYGRITLEDIRHLLPADGTTRFARHYAPDTEVVMSYEPRSVPEVPLPPDWEDPNFNHRGGRYNLTYTGFWPKQVTRQ